MTSAPLYGLPPELASFVAIEYPGPVGAGHASVERALEALGGLHRVSQALNAKEADKSLVELNYSSRPVNDRNFTHPILGEPVDTGNILLKITRRRRKHPAADGTVGCYSVQVAGIVKRTIRFRGGLPHWAFRKVFVDWLAKLAMADFQFQPDVKADEAVELIHALRTFDSELRPVVGGI